MKLPFNYLSRLSIILLILISQTACQNTLLQPAPSSDLSSVWVGEGYQGNTNEWWDMIFFYDKKTEQYIIQYPSLGCSGYWSLLKQDDETVEFRETITQGLDTCTNKGRVVMKKKDADTRVFFYYWPDDHDFSALGLLKKQ